MCGPMIVAGIGLAMSGVGTVVQMRAQQKAAKAAAEQEEYLAQQNLKNADVAAKNARESRRTARDAEKRGDEEVRRHSVRAQAVMDAQQQGLAAHGILVDAESAGDLSVETALLAKADFDVIRENASREAFGFQKRAQDFEVEQKNLKEAARFGFSRAGNIRQAGNLAAVGDLLSGGSELFKGGSELWRQSSKKYATA